MSRHEKALVAFAAVLLLSAWALCHDASQPQSAVSDGRIPVEVLLWQFRQLIAPAFALVGLASAVGILFLRAVRWAAIPDPPAQHAQLPEQTGTGDLPRG